MRWDVEIALAQTAVDYLKAVVWDAIQATCPVVTFFDPMAIDEASRIVVEVPDCQSTTEDIGHFSANLNIVVKTQWAQAALADDYATHYLRVNAVRDKLFPADLVTRLQAKQPTGLAINQVQPVRRFTTKTELNWIVSEAMFPVECYVTA